MVCCQETERKIDEEIWLQTVLVFAGVQESRRNCCVLNQIVDADSDQERMDLVLCPI